MMNNISEFSPFISGISNLKYIPLFFKLSVMSFAISILFIILYVVTVKSFLNQKIVNVFIIILLILFCSITLPSIISTESNYDEFSVFDDSNKPRKNVEEFFPYYDFIADNTEYVPYYSFSKYSINGNTYISSQIFSYENESDMIDSNSVSITIDYFESNKDYMMGKYNAEKSFLYSSDENGKALPSDLIQHGNADGYQYDVIILNNEKRFIIEKDNYYFTLVLENMDITNEEFIVLGLEQFSNMKNYSTKG
ncbi:MAG: hypothetical protein ACLUFN_04360 [Eubacterium sp.]